MMKPIWLGVMSGTSLDAIDVVAMQFEPLQTLGMLSVDFPAELRQQLLQLTNSGTDEIDRMGQAEVAYSLLVATTINQLIGQLSEHNLLERSQIVAVGCHGQTVRHRPQWRYTLQLGDGNILAEHCQIPVVTDFRRRDLAAGGQGAPLVPAFHQAIFGSNHVNRIILNLGGIANITVLPADPEIPVTGFDTGPANLLLDDWCLQHTGQPYDQGGQWAQSGQVIPSLLAACLDDPYFQLSAPKSTGRERFNPDWLGRQLQNQGQIAATYLPQDVQATLVALTVESVAQAVRQTGLPTGELVVCGGGALNGFLLRQLQLALPAWQLMTSEALGLAPQAVEAAAFAWLARCRMQQLSGNLPQVTGADGGRILGAVYLP